MNHGPGLGKFEACSEMGFSNLGCLQESHIQKRGIGDANKKRIWKGCVSGISIHS